MNKLIQKTVYGLKRDFGAPITLHRIVSESLDPETGTKTQTKATHKVPKAIVLPNILSRFHNPEIPVGGFYDSSTQRIIIDAKDVSNFGVKIGDYFHLNTRRWGVTEVHEFQSGAAYIVVAKEDVNTESKKIEDVRIYHRLTLKQTAIKA